MTEELINEARAFAALGSDLNPVEANRLIFELADALEAATAEPEWEYGTGHTLDPGIGAPETSREAAVIRADAWNVATRSRTGVVVRRRKAGPWFPVEGT